MFGVLKRRNFGLDVLKIVSIFVITLVVVLEAGGAFVGIQAMTFSGEVLNFVQLLFLCAINCFALITGYIGRESRYRYTSIISFCIRAVLYGVAITIAFIVVALIKGWDIEFWFLVKSMFPTLIGDYWYFTVYFCLFFFIPVLNHVIETMSRHNLRNSGLFIFFLCCLSRIFLADSVVFNAGFSFLWIMVLYMVGAYIAKYKPFENTSKRLNFCVFIVAIVLTVCIRALTGLITKGIFDEIRYVDMLMSFTSPTVLIASVALFNLFSKMVFCRTTRVIHSVSTTVFGVYLIVLHPVVYGIFFRMAFDFIGGKNVFLMLLLGIAVSLGVCAVAIGIELVRKKAFKILNVDRMIKFIEKALKKIKRKIFKILRMKDTYRW